MQSSVILVQEEPRGPSMLVQRDIVAGDTNVSFKDVPELRNSDTKRTIIKSIRLIVPGVTVGPLNVGTVLAPLTELQKMYLSIYCEQWIKAQAVPILEFNDIFIEGSGIPFRSAATKLNNWENFDWTKTFIQFANGTAAVGNYTVVLDIEYVNIDNDGGEIVGPAK